MELSLDELKKQLTAVELAIKAAEAAEAKPAIDTTGLVLLIDGAIKGMNLAVQGLTTAAAELQKVKAMLTNTEVKAETAVAVHPTEVGTTTAASTPSVTSAPKSIEDAATEAATKKKGWGKVWEVTKKVLKVATPVALAGATGGGSLAAYLPSVIGALSDPAVAGAAGASVAGAVAAGVRIYGALKTTDPKE